MIQSVEFEGQGRKRGETGERERLTRPRFTDVVSSENRFISFFSTKLCSKLFSSPSYQWVLISTLKTLNFHFCECPLQNWKTFNFGTQIYIVHFSRSVILMKVIKSLHLWTKHVKIVMDQKRKGEIWTNYTIPNYGRSLKKKRMGTN